MSTFSVPVSDKELFERAQGNSPSPNFFSSDESIPYWDWWETRLNDESLLRSAEGLAMLRFLALRATRCQPRRGWRFAQAWVQFLISQDSSSHNFFLQEYRAHDAAFYEEETLKTHRTLPAEWATVLPGIRTVSLTVPELELALVLFEWKSPGGKPVLSPWLRAHPHVLWRVHRFLLARYCFALLEPFRRALKASHRDLAHTTQRSLYTPPFRAGEFLTFYPRIAGLVAIGSLGLMEVDIAQVLFFATRWVWSLAAGALSVLLLFVLNYMDVYKQNRGVMSDRRHGVRRALGLLVLFLRWGVVMTSVYAGLIWIGSGAFTGDIQDWPGNPDRLNGLWNLLIPRFPPLGDGQWFCGLVAMAASSCLLGALLQWFFEDTAATEPI